MSKKSGIQFAALPFQITRDGLRVLLITSRQTRRWIIPKGWPIRGLKPRKVAACEAFEEAGLVGRMIGKRPIGTFHYEKRLPKDQLLCEVRVFLMWVGHQVDSWPEKGAREIRWFGPSEAADLVDEGGLAEVIRHAFASYHISESMFFPSAIAPKYTHRSPVISPTIQDAEFATAARGRRPGFPERDAPHPPVAWPAALR